MEVSRWDAADYIRTPEEAAEFLNLVLEDGDPDELAAALGAIARSEGMTKISERSGLTRASLYKALSSQGNPYFSTIVRVLGACGMHLEVVPDKRRTTAPA